MLSTEVALLPLLSMADGFSAPSTEVAVNVVSEDLSGGAYGRFKFPMAVAWDSFAFAVLDNSPASRIRAW